MQWRIWSLAAAGKFFEGYVVFMTGVALPLQSYEFGIGAAEHGIIGAASLFGILIGAVWLGGLSDKFGRKPMFIAEMIIFVAFLVGVVFAPNFYVLVICLFAIGLALDNELKKCTPNGTGTGRSVTQNSGHAEWVPCESFDTSNATVPVSLSWPSLTT